MKPINAGKRTPVPARAPASGDSRGARDAYGGKTPICMNRGCVLRKKAGGCFGFEGCPGFKAR